MPTYGPWVQPSSWVWAGAFSERESHGYRREGGPWYYEQLGPLYSGPEQAWIEPGEYYRAQNYFHYGGYPFIRSVYGRDCYDLTTAWLHHERNWWYSDNNILWFDFNKLSKASHVTKAPTPAQVAAAGAIGYELETPGATIWDSEGAYTYLYSRVFAGVTKKAGYGLTDGNPNSYEESTVVYVPTHADVAYDGEWRRVPTSLYQLLESQDGSYGYPDVVPVPIVDSSYGYGWNTQYQDTINTPPDDNDLDATLGPVIATIPSPGIPPDPVVDQWGNRYDTNTRLFHNANGYSTQPDPSGWIGVYLRLDATMDQIRTDLGSAESWHQNLYGLNNNSWYDDTQTVRAQAPTMWGYFYPPRHRFVYADPVLPDVVLQGGGEASSATSVRVSSLPSPPAMMMSVEDMTGQPVMLTADFPADQLEILRAQGGEL